MKPLRVASSKSENSDINFPIVFPIVSTKTKSSTLAADVAGASIAVHVIGGDIQSELLKEIESLHDYEAEHIYFDSQLIVTEKFYRTFSRVKRAVQTDVNYHVWEKFNALKKKNKQVFLVTYFLPVIILMIGFLLKKLLKLWTV